MGFRTKSWNLFFLILFYLKQDKLVHACAIKDFECDNINCTSASSYCENNNCEEDYSEALHCFLCDTKRNCLSKGLLTSVPPVLNINASFINVKTNTSLEITCLGEQELSWKIHRSTEDEMDNRIIINSSVNHSATIYKYESSLTLPDLNFMDTNLYSCYYKGTNYSNPEDAVSLYVFVNDPMNLFVKFEELSGHILLPVEENRSGKIPCLPTNSETNVTLWSEKDDYVYEIVNLSKDIMFNPMEGFIFNDAIFYHGTDFQCRAPLENSYEEINVTFIYTHAIFEDNRPFIDTIYAQNTIVNGSFILKCIFAAEPKAELFFEWNYPNKVSMRERFVETEAFSEWAKLGSYYVHEFVSYLIVREAKKNDTGIYNCSATDGGKRVGWDSMLITVTDTPIVHRLHAPVLNISSSYISLKSKSSLQVSCFGNLTLQWKVEKHKEKEKDNHLSIDTFLPDTQSVHQEASSLTVRNVGINDTGFYSCYYEGKPRQNSTSLYLYVDDDEYNLYQPFIDISEAQNIETGKTFTLKCTVTAISDIKLFIDWIYPNKNDAAVRINETESFYQLIKLGNFFVKHFTSYLIVNNAQASDSGEYMCSVTDDAQGIGLDKVRISVTADAYHDYQVFKFYQPVIDLREEHISVSVNGTFELKCFTSIEPENDGCYLRWDFPNKKNSGTRIKIMEDFPRCKRQGKGYAVELGEHITVNNAEISDSGLYVCSIIDDSRNIGYNKVWITVSYTSNENLKISLDISENKKPLLNRNFALKCSVNIDKESEYTVGWMYPNKKDLGTRINETKAYTQWRRVDSYYAHELVSYLTVEEALTSDSGTYTCFILGKHQKLGSEYIRISVDDYEDTESNFLAGTPLTIVACITALASFLLFIVCFIRCQRRKKKNLKGFGSINRMKFEKGNISIFNPNLPLDGQIDLLPYNKIWEFPKERLKFGKAVGQGSFGKVVVAEAIGIIKSEVSTTVAVKMLKENAGEAERNALIAELKILIHIGKHLNVVNLLGAVTTNIKTGELYVIEEYCCHGNLRHFLQKYKERYIEEQTCETDSLSMKGKGTDSSKEYSNYYDDILSSDESTNPIVRSSICSYDSIDLNFKYPFESSQMGNGHKHFPINIVENNYITAKNLLSFAFQSARGMEYLSSKKLIHRDLAARNVLLAKHYVIKICDFGLTKQCYKYPEYVKVSGEPLPLKWTAVESVKNGVFTTKSDVWSFGVLLWEIFSLGGSPYPGLKINEEFFEKLDQGYRMEKPELAPDKIYDLMMHCWMKDPSERPDFTSLAEAIGVLLESNLKKFYVGLNKPYEIANEKLRNISCNRDSAGESEEYTEKSDPSASGSQQDSIFPLNIFNVTSEVDTLSPKDSKEFVIKLKNNRETTERNEALHIIA